MPMQDRPTLSILATVVGQGTDPDYLLAEDAQERQFVVRRKVFEGAWSAVGPGDLVELVVTREALSRVLRARRLPGASS